MPKRIRPASHYQRRDSKLRLLAMVYKRAIKRDLVGALKQLGKEFDATKAHQLAMHGNYGLISRDAINWQHFREVLKGVFDRIAQCHEAGARLAVDRINARHRRHGRAIRFGKKEPGGEPSGSKLVQGVPRDVATQTLDELFDVSKAIGDRFNFDRFTPETLESLRAEQDALIVGLETDARQTINMVINSTVQAGLRPDSPVAFESIRSVIGLTDRQAQAVINYRSMIGDLDSGALARQLRDTQYDSAFARAMENGTELGDELIDEMVDAYTENYLDYRASTIAQTEAVRASNTGLQDAYEQAITRGAIPAEALRQFWKVSLDEKTCEVCLSIPEMNPDGVPIGEDFESIDGPQSVPPDPHVNCRCEIEIVTDLDLVPDE